MSAQVRFLLDPKTNEDFVAGRGPRKHLTRRAVLVRYLLAAAAVNAILVGAQAWAYWSRWSTLPETSKREALVAIPVTIVLNLILRAIYGVFRRRAQQEERLTQHGRILEGRVVSCTGKFDGSLWVHLDYSFLTPDGRHLTGKGTQVRPDLQGARMPEPGTPVAVAYVDDSLHQVM